MGGPQCTSSAPPKAPSAVAEEDASAATAVVTTPQEKEARRPTTEDGAEGDKAETCEGEKVNKGTNAPNAGSQTMGTAVKV